MGWKRAGAWWGAVAMVWSLLAAPAIAQDEDLDAVEEIIVYGDDFARWNNTRWLVNSELILPLPLFLGSDNNLRFMSYAMQTRMVLLCEKDGKIKPKRIEVMCEIEDIGIKATSVRLHKREKDRARAQTVLDQIDAKLTGAKIQLQVDFKGGVNNVDLEGVPADNERERRNRENLRQILLRMVAGFHMKIPDHAQREGQWIEYNSKLMSLPSLTAARGSTTMVHTVSRHPGYQIVQTLGQGTTATKLPNFNADRPDLISTPSSDTLASGSSSSGGIGLQSRTGSADAPSDTFEGFGETGGNELDVEATYSLETTGVAIFERETGIMTERVWVTNGIPTASSAGGTLNNPFRNIGRVQMLGQADAPDVGPTVQVSWPGHKMEGLPTWTDLDVTPGQ